MGLSRQAPGFVSGMVGLALVAGAVSTFYSSPSSSLLVVAGSFPRLLAARPLLALPWYLVSLIPLLRLVYSFSVAWNHLPFCWGYGWRL